jgi:hypothetical protein
MKCNSKCKMKLSQKMKYITQVILHEERYDRREEYITKQFHKVARRYRK